MINETDIDYEVSKNILAQLVGGFVFVCVCFLGVWGILARCTVTGICCATEAHRGLDVNL